MDCLTISHRYPSLRPQPLPDFHEVHLPEKKVAEPTKPAPFKADDWRTRSHKVWTLGADGKIVWHLNFSFSLFHGSSMYEDVLDQGSETFNIKTYLIPKMKIKLHIAKVLYSAVHRAGA